MDELSAEICNELVVELDKVRFLGEGVGSLLSDYIFLSLHRLPSESSFFTSLLENLRFLKAVLFNAGQNVELKSIRPGQTLFLYQSDRPDYLNFTKPIVERVGYKHSVIYGISPDVFNKWPSGATVIDLTMLPKVEKLLWWREFRKCIPLWKKVLVDFESKYHLDSLMPILRTGFVKATYQLIRANKFLELTKPSVVVTDYDRSSQIAPFIAAANSLKIPTVTSIQNVTESSPSFGIFPSIAENICCWGKMMFDDAIEHHEPLRKLHVLGNQNYLGNTCSSDDGTGPSGAKYTITLALSPFRQEVVLRIVELFVDALSKMENVSGIIRLHPAQKRSDFTGYKFRNITLSTHSEISKDILIGKSLVVVGHETSFLTDAVLRGTPVVVLDLLSRPLKLGGKLIRHGGMPVVKSSKELRTTLGKILHDKNYLDTLRLGARSYCNALNCAEGSKAADNIYELIRSLKETAVNATKLELTYSHSGDQG